MDPLNIKWLHINHVIIFFIIQINHFKEIYSKITSKKFIVSNKLTYLLRFLEVHNIFMWRKDCHMTSRKKWLYLLYISNTNCSQKILYNYLMNNISRVAWTYCLEFCRKLYYIVYILRIRQSCELKTSIENKYSCYIRLIFE